MSEPCVVSAAVPPVSDRPAEPVTAQPSLALQATQTAHTAAAEREQWLFRHATLAGQVHPLRHLLKRYRAGERA